MKELCAVIEAILFVSGDPVRVEDLAHSMNMTASEMETALTGACRPSFLGEPRPAAQPLGRRGVFVHPPGVRAAGGGVFAAAGKAAALAGGAGNAVHHRLPPAGDEVGHRAGARREVRLFRAGAALPRGSSRKPGGARRWGGPSSTARRTPFCGILAFPHWKNFRRWTSRPRPKKWEHRSIKKNAGR